MPDAVPLGPTDPPRLGRYELTGRLGASDRGHVYVATGPGGERVAITLLHEDLDPEQRERFFQEAEKLRQVSPFCTAQVLETGTSGAQPYIVREHIDGPTLQEAVAATGPLPVGALYRLAIGTMTALVAIHQAGIVHRDLRPGTIVLGQDGPRVVDYGLSPTMDASSGDETRPGAMPAYIAPEQFEGATLGSAADMFSWAATIVYAASGRQPFEAATPGETMERIRHGDADLSALDHHLGSVVSDCLAKDRRLRPSASLALLRLLEHAQAFNAGGPAVVPPGAQVPPYPPGAPSGDMLPVRASRSAPPPPPPPPGGQGHPVAPPGAYPPGPGGPGDPAGPTGPYHGGPPGPYPGGPPGPYHGGPPGPYPGGPPGPGPVHPGAPPPPGPTGPGGYPAGPPGSAPYPAGPPLPDAPLPESKSRRRWPLLVGVPLVVLLVAAVGIVGYQYVTAGGAATPTPPPKAATPAAPTPFTAPAGARPPKEPDNTVTLPGTGITVHEHAEDPVQLQAYHVDKDDSPVYVRDPKSGEFAETEKAHDPVVSPGGTWLALVPQSPEQNAVTIVNRDSGERFTVDTAVKAPRRVEAPVWSPDGLKLLLTAFNYEGDERQGPAGFVIVDIAARKATLTETGDDEETGAYRWGRTPSTVAKLLPGKKDKQNGIRIYGMEGEVVHDMDWVGTPQGHEFFSPDLKQFLTTCPRGERSICVWDSAGGERQVTIKSASEGRILGWWDNKHIIDRETSSGTHKVVVRDMKGKVKRTLAEIPQEDADVALRFTRR